MSEKQLALTAEDFGPGRYGVHLYSHEDDWGWTAFGHHHPRRIIAAINHEAREYGVRVDLIDAMNSKDIEAGIKRRWARAARRTEDFIEWDWCEFDTPGAFAITVVNP